MPTSTTRKQLRQAVIKRLYSPRYPIVSTFSGAASAASAIKDDQLSPAALDNDYQRAWVYVSSDAGSGPSIGEVVRVISTDFDNDELNVAPDFSATPQSGDEYELHYWMHPDEIHDVIDEILENLEHVIIVPLTLITDGDMNNSTAGSFTPDGSIVSKDTTNVLHGKQSLKVLATANNGNARTTSVAVDPDSTLICATDLYLSSTTGGAQLVLYDVTNGAEIESGLTDVLGWSTIRFTAQVPSTCKEVRFNLQVVTGGDQAYFDNAILQQVGSKVFTFPSQAEWSFDLKRAFYYPRGPAITTSSASNSYSVLNDGPRYFSHFTVERDETAVVPYRVVLDKPVGDNPVWVGIDVDHVAFSGATDALKDADTTTAPFRAIRDLALAEIYERMADDAYSNENDEHGARLELKAERLRNSVVQLREFRESDAVIIGAMRGG